MSVKHKSILTIFGIQHPE